MIQEKARIDLNKAGYDDLVKVPGVDGTKAQQIMYYRDLHGPFRNWEDLKSIPGFDDKMLEIIRAHAFLGEAGGLKAKQARF